MNKLWLAALPLLIVSCSRMPDTSTEELAKSIQKGQTYLLALAMQEDPSGNFEQDSKVNLLQIAVESHNRDAAALLLLHGANPNGSGRYWESPLLFAVKQGNVEMAKMLLSYRADPNYLQPLSGIDKNKNGAQMAELLKQYKADPNFDNKLGSCLLAAAVRKGEWYVRTLLEMGANPDGVGKGWTPLEEARELKDGRIIKLLMRYGASERPFARQCPNSYDPDRDIREFLLSKGAQHGR